MLFQIQTQFQCSWCSSPAHPSRNYLGRVRCWKYSFFGHIKRYCGSAPTWHWKPKGGFGPTHWTQAEPKLIWMPKIPAAAAVYQALDSRMDFPDASPSLLAEQEQQINFSHPLPPSQSTPPSSSELKENPIASENPSTSELAAAEVAMANFFD